MKKYSYALAYFILMFLPASVLVYFVRDTLEFKPLLLVVLFSFLLGGIFDIWAVKQGKKDKFYIWEYNSKTILGYKLFGVPIEDSLLFLVITPILIISVWEGLKKYFNTGEIRILWIVAISVLLLMVIYRLVYKIAGKR